MKNLVGQIINTAKSLSSRLGEADKAMSDRQNLRQNTRRNEKSKMVSNICSILSNGLRYMSQKFHKTGKERMKT